MGRKVVKSSLIRTAAVLAILSMFSFTPTPASAGGQTLKRSMGNLTQFPLDIVLAPITAGRRLAINMKEHKDPMAVRIAFFIPGYIFLTGTNAFGSVLRGFAGLAELPPGLVLIFRKDAEMYPLFPITEKGGALVDHDTRAFRFKFGIDYAGGNVVRGIDPETGL